MTAASSGKGIAELPVLPIALRMLIAVPVGLSTVPKPWRLAMVVVARLVLRMGSLVEMTPLFCPSKMTIVQSWLSTLGSSIFSLWFRLPLRFMAAAEVAELLFNMWIMRRIPGCMVSRRSATDWVGLASCFLPSVTLLPLTFVSCAFARRGRGLQRLAWFPSGCPWAWSGTSSGG